MTWDDEAVGYGKPPVWTRFPRGRSGNPNGRPRRIAKAAPEVQSTSQQDDLLRRALTRTIEITESGKRRDASVLEVVQQVQISSATKGNVIAQRDVLRAARELEERDLQRAQAAAEQEVRLFKYMLDWRSEQSKLWCAATARGIEPDQPWPHPDDFVIDHGHGTCWIRGPADAGSVELYTAIRADRDVTLVQAVLALRQRGGWAAGMRFYAHISMEYDAMLPLRWQSGVDGWLKTATSLLILKLPYVRMLLDCFQRHAAMFVRPAISEKDAHEIYRVINRAMLPQLRRLRFRSLKQLEAAHPEPGRKMIWQGPNIR